jgi:hypothetical protein
MNFSAAFWECRCKTFVITSSYVTKRRGINGDKPKTLRGDAGSGQNFSRPRGSLGRLEEKSPTGSVQPAAWQYCASILS